MVDSPAPRSGLDSGISSSAGSPAPAADSGAAASNTAGGDDYALPPDYKPYVPVAKRRAAMMASLGVVGKRPTKKLRTAEDEAYEAELRKRELETEKDREEREREAARRDRTLLEEAQEVKRRKELEGGYYGCCLC